MHPSPDEPSFRFVTIRVLSLSTLALSMLCAGGCQDRKARNETAVLVMNLDGLRNAPNEMKRDPLQKLKSSSCTDRDVCAARDACTQAFEHHVRGMELGSSVRKTLDQNPSPSPVERDAMRAHLLEANIELEEGRTAMPDCENRIAELRLKHKL